jgi:hypothetical protein
MRSTWLWPTCALPVSVWTVAGNHPPWLHSDNGAVIDPTLQIIVALTAATASAAAQGVTPTPPAQAADTSSIIFAPKPSAPAPVPTPSVGTADRPVSSAVAADISLGMPAYSPELSAPKLGASAADLRDIDKPKNQIPRLPLVMMQKYVVRESRLPVFRNLDLYTKAGLIDLSFKEHPGLRIGNFFNLNAKVAYNMIKDEELFAERQDLADTVLAMAVDGDTEEARLMQKAISDESFRSYVSHKY